MNEPNTRHRVVVIGGGHAGTTAANRLRLRNDVEITLVNPVRGLSIESGSTRGVAGTGDATVDFGTRPGEGIELVVDRGVRIDTTARVVRLASGRALDHDYVIYAVGSTAAIPAVPGAAEFAFPLAEFESAQRLRARLDEVPLDAPVTVVGGGPTGIETAAELAEQGRAVTLVSGGGLMPPSSAPGRRMSSTGSTSPWSRAAR